MRGLLMFNESEGCLAVHMETNQCFLNKGKLLEKDMRKQKFMGIDVQMKPGLGPVALSLIATRCLQTPPILGGACLAKGDCKHLCPRYQEG